MKDKAFQNIRNKSKMTTEQFMVEGDRWLLEQGIISDVTKNNIILNLYMNYPKAKYIEYFLDLNNKTIDIHLHFGFWSYLFTSNEKTLDVARDILSGYLVGYDISVKRVKYAKKNQT